MATQSLKKKSPGRYIYAQVHCHYSPITYYWTGVLILDHSYLVRNLTNLKLAETKALKPKILTLVYRSFSNLLISQQDMSGPRLGTQSNNM